MKSCSAQALSCILRQCIYWGIFSFGLHDVVNLSTTFFIQRFLRFLFFIFFIKNAFFKRFLFLGSTFFTSMILCPSAIGIYIFASPIHSYSQRRQSGLECGGRGSW